MLRSMVGRRPMCCVSVSRLWQCIRFCVCLCAFLFCCLCSNYQLLLSPKNQISQYRAQILALKLIASNTPDQEDLEQRGKRRTGVKKKDEEVEEDV